jgi:hypothetical protein
MITVLSQHEEILVLGYVENRKCLPEKMCAFAHAFLARRRKGAPTGGVPCSLVPLTSQYWDGGGLKVLQNMVLLGVAGAPRRVVVMSVPYCRV